MRNRYRARVIISILSLPLILSTGVVASLDHRPQWLWIPAVIGFGGMCSIWWLMYRDLRDWREESFLPDPSWQAQVEYKNPDDCMSEIYRLRIPKTVKMPIMNDSDEVIGYEDVPNVWVLGSQRGRLVLVNPDEASITARV